jgi:hypothetical protein
MLHVSQYARRVLLAIGVLVILNTGVALAAPSGDPSSGRSFIEKARRAVVRILEDIRVIWPPG